MTTQSSRATPLPAQESAQESAQDATDKSAAPPELSLESLYHPKSKYDFDGKLPKTHWIDDSPSRLLIQRDEQWREFDLQSGTERPLPLVDQLIRQLGQLDGLKEGQSASAANSAVAKMKTSSDTVLVRIDNSLAVVGPNLPARWLTRDASAWGNAQLGPRGRWVGYTKDGDLHLVDSVSGRSHRLTDDGTDTILDGILDWTYQEEIFGRGNYRGFWFSHDGRSLAMLRIDISGIEPYVLSSTSSDRGKGIVRRYPKAGDPIPQAGLFVWDLSKLESDPTAPPKSHSLPAAKLIEQSTAANERIITGVWWSPQRTALLYSISDRVQSWRELRRVDESFLSGESNATDLLIREESPTWVEPPAAPSWLPDGGLVWRSELPTGRYRLYQLSAAGHTVSPLTPESFNVRSFTVSNDGRSAVVMGDAAGGSDQHVYRVELNRPGQLYAVTRLPGWHAAEVSPDGEWILDQHSTPTTPNGLTVVSVSTGRKHVIAEPHLKVPGELVPPISMGLNAGDGVMLPAMLYRPPAAGPQNQCGVVVEVYSGPQSATVSSRWGGSRALYRELLARNGIATLMVDNRSSAGKGVADSWPVYRKFGEVEFKDLMVAVDWLKAQPWVDSNRLAIRGWSFGGFMTLYAMTHTDAFTAGIAGGSVTDWREYDAFYTERYMGLPKENPEGYKSTAPVALADKLEGTVLLIHGEADDNVHPSNTMRMAVALQKAGKDFRLMIYPGNAHAIHNPQQAWHMNQMIHRFLLEKLHKQ